MRHKNLILVTVDILLILSIITIFVISSLKSATLTILTVPSDAVVIIDNKEFSSGAYRFFPGEITATVTKDGFDTKEVSMTLEKNTNNRLFVYLTKDGKLSYLRDTPADFESLKTISNISSDENLKSFIKDYEDEQALKDFLPIYYDDIETGISYSIKYETAFCRNNNYCILISGNTIEDQILATNALKQYGYDTAKYELVYIKPCEKGDQECIKS